MKFNIFLRLTFGFHIVLGVMSIFMDKPDHGLPINTGWIIILGFLNILDKMEVDSNK